MDKDAVIGCDALHASMLKCQHGVRWKGTTGHFVHNWPDEIYKLSEALKDGSYRERRQKFFTITEPKRREIMSISFRDRVYQRSLNDVAIYPQTSRSYIADNFACQDGKGTDAARERLEEFLRRYYRRHGTEGYALKMDIKGYYPNMDRKTAEEMLKHYVDPETYSMALGVLRRMPGTKGYNPGSQIVQIIGVTMLDKLDHYIKERLRIKYYVRYMDDLILLHPDKDYLEAALEKIAEVLEALKMELNPKKTRITRIAEPIRFLGFVFRLTATGKVAIFADPKKIKHERKKIIRMAALVRRGELQKRDVDAHFKAYKASIRYGCSHKLICRLNAWYRTLWEGEKKCGQNRLSRNVEARSQKRKTSRTLSPGTREETLSSSMSPPATTLKSLRRREKTMSKIFYEMAKKNYPALWNRSMIDNFYALGRLTQAEYEDVVGGGNDGETGDDDDLGAD